MKSKLILFVGISLLFSDETLAFDIHDCGPVATENIRQAYQYLLDNRKTLKDFEFEGRLPRKDVRVRRKLDRKMPRMDIVCLRNDGHLCSGTTTGFSPHNAIQWILGAPFVTSRMGVCYNNIRESETPGNGKFCKLVGVLAHETGHAVSMPIKAGHNIGDGSNLDTVYQFGNFAEDMCEQDQMNRTITNNTTSNPNAPNRPDPFEGLYLYHNKNFEPHDKGRQTTPGENDMREIGWNDAVSSVRLFTTPNHEIGWMLCPKMRYGGWCTEVAGDIADLGDRKLNNKTSSMKGYGKVVNGAIELTSGITVYKHKNYEGGIQWFTNSQPKLKDWKINDSMSSIKIHAGEWELCTKSDYRGTCKTFTGDVANLKDVKMNDKVSSIKRISAGQQDPIAHQVPAPYGGWYSSASMAWTGAEIDGPSSNFDSNEFGWSVAGAYRLDETWSFEAKYADYGDHSDQGASVDIDGFTIFAVANTPIDDTLQVFGKLGATLVDVSADNLLGVSGNSDLDVAAGIGLRYRLSPRYSIRGDLEWSKPGDLDNLFMLSVGIEIRITD